MIFFADHHISLSCGPSFIAWSGNCSRMFSNVSVDYEISLKTYTSSFVRGSGVRLYTESSIINSGVIEYIWVKVIKHVFVSTSML